MLRYGRLPSRHVRHVPAVGMPRVSVGPRTTAAAAGAVMRSNHYLTCSVWSTHRLALRHYSTSQPERDGESAKAHTDGATKTDTTSNKFYRDDVLGGMDAETLKARHQETKDKGLPSSHEILRRAHPKHDNLYARLGLTKTTCSPELVRHHYKILAKKYHPDLNQADDAQELFQRIGEAHRILVKEKTREVYDTTGRRAQATYTGEDEGKEATFMEKYNFPIFMILVTGVTISVANYANNRVRSRRRDRELGYEEYIIMRNALAMQDDEAEEAARKRIRQERGWKWNLFGNKKNSEQHQVGGGSHGDGSSESSSGPRYHGPASAPAVGPLSNSVLEERRKAIAEQQRADEEEYRLFAMWQEQQRQLALEEHAAPEMEKLTGSLG